MSICSIEHYLTPEQKLNFRQVISDNPSENVLDLYDKYFFDSKLSKRFNELGVTVVVSEATKNEVRVSGKKYVILCVWFNAREFERLLFEVMVKVCDPSLDIDSDDGKSLFSEIFGDGGFSVITDYGLIRANVSSMSINILSKLAKVSKEYRELVYPEIYSRILENITDPDYRELLYFYPELQTDKIKNIIYNVSAPYRFIVILLNSIQNAKETGQLIKNTSDSARFLYDIIDSGLNVKLYRQERYNVLWAAGIRTLHKAFSVLFADPEVVVYKPPRKLTVAEKKKEAQRRGMIYDHKTGKIYAKKYKNVVQYFDTNVQLFITSPSMLQFFILKTAEADKANQDATSYIMKVIAMKCFTNDYHVYRLFLKFIPVDYRKKIDDLFNGNIDRLYLVLGTLMTVYFLYVERNRSRTTFIHEMIKWNYNHSGFNVMHFSRRYALNLEILVFEEEGLHELINKLSTWRLTYPNVENLTEAEKNTDLVKEPWIHLLEIYTTQELSNMTDELYGNTTDINYVYPSPDDDDHDIEYISQPGSPF